MSLPIAAEAAFKIIAKAQGSSGLGGMLARRKLSRDKLLRVVDHCEEAARVLREALSEEDKAVR